MTQAQIPTNQLLNNNSQYCTQATVVLKVYP